MMFMLRKYIYFLSLVAMVLVMNPQASYSAAAPEVDINNRKQMALPIYCIPKGDEYVRALLKCITEPIRKAVLDRDHGLLKKTTDIAGILIIPLITLVLIGFGIRVITGDSNIFPRGMSLAIRAGVVIFLIWNMHWIAPNLFMILDQIVGTPTTDGAITAAWQSPWKLTDEYLNKLIKFNKETTPSINDLISGHITVAEYVASLSSTGRDGMEKGIVGLLSGSFLSKNFGFMIGIVGFLAVFIILLNIVQMLYIYIASIILIGFMVITLPLFIPFFMFTYTEKYLLKWIDIYAYTILTPLMMMVFMSLFLIGSSGRPASGGEPAVAAVPAIIPGAVDKIIASVPRDYMEKAFWANIPVTGERMLIGDPTLNLQIGRLGEPTLGYNIDNSPYLGFMAPTLGNAMYDNDDFGYGVRFGSNRIDFGDDDWEIKTGIYLALLELLIYVVLMATGLRIIPSICSDICRGASTGIENLASPIVNMIRQSSSRR